MLFEAKQKRSRNAKWHGIPISQPAAAAAAVATKKGKQNPSRKFLMQSALFLPVSQLRVCVCVWNIPGIIKVNSIEFLDRHQ